jgi:hypothetical protein
MNFDTAVQALVDSEVEFIVIGGWSAILHDSISPATYDLDFYFRVIKRILGEWSPRCGLFIRTCEDCLRMRRSTGMRRCFEIVRS